MEGEIDGLGKAPSSVHVQEEKGTEAVRIDGPRGQKRQSVVEKRQTTRGLEKRTDVSADLQEEEVGRRWQKRDPIATVYLTDQLVKQHL